MAIATSADGSFTINSSTGVVRNASIELNRDALETTDLGDDQRKYTYGLLSGSGTATFLFDASTNLDSSVFDTVVAGSDSDVTITMTLDSGGTNERITGDAIITGVGTSMTVGDITSVNCSFSLNGTTTVKRPGQA